MKNAVLIVMLATTLLLWGCSGSGNGAADDGGGLGADGNEPVSCETNTDCEAAGACPADATKGCACAETPSGMKCVPSCTAASDCTGADHVCTNGVCVPGGNGDGGTPPGDGGGPQMNTANTVSDQAQGMTIAFDGLAFVTGTFCAQTFYPPGKVADFFGFQYLRDNDPSNLGHNTEFTTLTADPVLALLTSDQVQILADLGDVDAPMAEEYARARFPLAMAFRRLADGDAPSGHPALDVNAVKAFSAYLFEIDGRMSYLRAQAYASVLNSLSTSQKATLDAMKGTGAGTWTQPSQTSVDAVLHDHPSQGDLRTYAGEMLAWYLGGTDPDVYFCPERQATYFGSFFMKDIKAMHNPNYTIDSNMTADMGNAFLDALATEQKAQVTGLVAQQKADLLAIVDRRTDISDQLRQFLAQGSVTEADVLALARTYGELDGEISFYYATAFASVWTSLSADQQSTLIALRKTATAESDGSADYDDQCGNGYLYSAPLQQPPTVIDTDFMFGACMATGTSCQSDWDCCSYTCSSGHCG